MDKMVTAYPPHLEERFGYLDGLPKKGPPQPWRLIGEYAVGGLTDVGFGISTDLLLVISSGNGRGVFDCVTGERVARDHSEDFEFDTGNLLAAGIGPLEGEKIRIGGLHGGGLALITEDGWSLERHPLKWPEAELFLGADYHSLLWSPPNQPIAITKLDLPAESLRAFGFSPTGRSFVIGTPSDLLIYSR